jgi:hypothetical protein
VRGGHGVAVPPPKRECTNQDRTSDSSLWRRCKINYLGAPFVGRTKREDKVANHEGWRHRNHDPGALASRAIDRCAALEGKIELAVTVERTPPADSETTHALAVEKD